MKKFNVAKIIVLLFFCSVASANNLQDYQGTDTMRFNAALADLLEGESVHVPFAHYKITSQLVEPNARYWGIVGSDGEKPIIDISELPKNSAFIAITKRGATVKNLKIIGNTALRHQYVPIGIKVGGGIQVSNFTLQSLNIQKTRVAIKFNNAQDSQVLSGLELFNNHTDVLITGTASSSLKFMNSSFLFSERSFVQESAIANLVIRDSVFAAAPYESGIKPVDLNHTIYGGIITGNRFEIHAKNNQFGRWDSLFIEGASASHPIQSLKISDNYFTGKAIDNSINASKSVSHLKIHDNFFMTNPLGYDIKRNHWSVKGVSSVRNIPRVSLKRALKDKF